MGKKYLVITFIFFILSINSYGRGGLFQPQKDTESETSAPAESRSGLFRSPPPPPDGGGQNDAPVSDAWMAVGGLSILYLFLKKKERKPQVM